MRLTRCGRPLLRAALIAVVLGANPAHAAGATPEIDALLQPEVKVNGKAISRAQVDLLTRTLMTSGAGDEATAAERSRIERRKAAVSDLVTQEVLAQAAVAAGLDKNPEIVDVLAYQRREVLARVFLQSHFEDNPIDEAQIRAGYEHARTSGQFMEYKVRQILVPTQAEAQAILDRHAKGESLASLVKLTRDPGGNTNGGLVVAKGWFRPDIFVDIYFSDAVEKLKAGKPAAAPVRSRFGWHVLWMDEPARKVTDAPPYERLDDGAREALVQRESQRRMNALTQNLLDKAKLVDAGGKAIPVSTLRATN